ncbi:MAG TPA: hypothetical protein PKM15_00835 [bacterium]|nr:hypothetical protein [bacterium]
MKKQLLAIIAGLFLSLDLSAQLMVASPGTDAAIETQTLLMSNLAIQQRIKEYQHYVEYISQFVEVIASIKNTTSTIRDISKMGRELKERSADEWLADVEKHINEVMPEYSELKNEMAGMVKGGHEMIKGKYYDYVSKWSGEVKNYHESLLKNYDNHVMFPELYPAAQKMKDGFTKGESAKKVIHKAWIESGLEYEMKNDIVRKNTFKNYYDEYLKQAKSNDNIEALGLANLMQSQYISVELLENLKKNSDLAIMKEQFLKDMSDAYLEVKKKLESEEKKRNKPSEIFGLKEKK